MGAAIVGLLWRAFAPVEEIEVVETIEVIEAQDGDCVKLKYSPLTGLTFVPERHKKGERNCK